MDLYVFKHAESESETTGPLCGALYVEKMSDSRLLFDLLSCNLTSIFTDI